MRIGIGYDVHKFEKGRKLMLGGMTIPHAKGLAGHSDADVLVHALMDALLGAAGLDDIGHLFPNTDPVYRNASSLMLLTQVMGHLRAQKYTVGNVDVTVIAEEPKIGRFIPGMKKHLAELLNVAPEQIGIKATTNEGMGFIGRGEGIAAVAVALIEQA
jgi:2-C-methyl-D-erythritol 2,4-cyclodiphosphate synthase